MELIDFILHVDAHLLEFITNYGVWIYAILFLIIFVETGLVVMPFYRETACYLQPVRWRPRPVPWIRGYWAAYCLLPLSWAIP